MVLELTTVGWKLCTQLSTSGSFGDGAAQNAGKTFPEIKNHDECGTDR
jgi:hypothetical protein